MLQFAAVITTGGIVLFSNIIDLDKSIILALINRIIDSKNLQSTFTILKLKINYVYDAVLGLIFVIGWNKQIVLEYPEKLLYAMSLQCKAYHQKIIWKDDLIIDAPDFKEPWQTAFQHWKSYISRKEDEGTVMKKFSETKKGNVIKKKEDKKAEKKQEKKDEKEEDKQQSDEEKVTNTPVQDNQNQNQKTNQNAFGNEENDDEETDLSPRQRFLKRQKQKQQSKSPKSKKSPKKEQKEDRYWAGGPINQNMIDKLDRSSKNENVIVKSAKYDGTKDELEKIDGYLDSDEETDLSKGSSFFNKWMNKVKNIVGEKTITKEDIEEVIEEFKKKLMEKNVAQEVADKVSEAVAQTLLQTKTKSFTTVYATVNEALKEALRKILTPKKKIDLVVEITKHREKLKPYVIVFIGVNGVGKSTNLAKVAYKLKNAKLSVMLAACDNFRAGAVEQIKTHGRNLDIPVFDKGYKEDPSNIAFEAIRDATRKRIDVVLIDTAGRMQDNTPLMKQLAQIVKINKPNLVVFIGEALVGNDAVDQITKFNKAIEQQSIDGHPAEINGILLSKFDTVDDKVGAALSLVYSTGKPILFIGVGQKYPNLKELNVNTVIQSILS